jgi:diguanylate cyclase (GGDEF)-like protein
VAVRIDQETDQCLAALARLRWFARELYPVALKLCGRFRPLEKAEALLPALYSLTGLSPKDVLVLPELEVAAPAAPPAPGAPQAAAQPAAEAAAATGPGTEPAAAPGTEAAAAQAAEQGLNEEFHGILTLLEYAFPGSRLERIAGGDYSSLFWFHQRIFSDGEPRASLHSRRADFRELLWKVSREDPVAPVILLHEVAGRMLGCLGPEALARMADPLSGGAAHLERDLERLRREWAAAREELLLRYLKEIDLLEKEISLRAGEVRGRYLDSPSGRKTVETVNQIRNHLIKGYGHVALGLDRRELFHCRPLYTICKELLSVLTRVTVDRRQLQARNPVAIQRLERADIACLEDVGGGSPGERRASGQLERGAAAPDRLLRQILSLIQALPAEKRLLDSPRAEATRVFLDLLTGVLELLAFLTADPRSPLYTHGAEVRFAGSVEKAVRAEIRADKTPLRVDLRRDLELTDRLTGLATKNEYLALMPALFRRAAESGEALTLLVLDLDRFKTINDTLGHDFGDEILKLAAEVLLSCRREEDLAVRFGGDEMLVVLRGDWIAGMRQAERIRSVYARLLHERHAEALKEIPRLAAQKERAARRGSDSLPAAGVALEELAARWKGLALATLSIGVAQGLGRLEHPCADEKQLFRRADRMQYLAKDAGGNRAVVMAEDLQVPLTHAEFREYLEYRGADRDPRSFPTVLLAAGRPLAHGGYSLEQYLSESANSG